MSNPGTFSRGGRTKWKRVLLGLNEGDTWGKMKGTGTGETIELLRMDTNPPPPGFNLFLFREQSDCRAHSHLETETSTRVRRLVEQRSSEGWWQTRNKTNKLKNEAEWGNEMKQEVEKSRAVSEKGRENKRKWAEDVQVLMRTRVKQDLRSRVLCTFWRDNVNFGAHLKQWKRHKSWHRIGRTCGRDSGFWILENKMVSSKWNHFKKLERSAKCYRELLWAMNFKRMEGSSSHHV